MSETLEITGKITHILDPQSGTSANGDWKKQEFVIETENQYPKHIKFLCFGKAVDLVENLNIDDNVTVSFNLESREYNEKWYTDAKAWRIVNNSPATKSKSVDPLTESQRQLPDESTGSDDLPF